MMMGFYSPVSADNIGFVNLEVIFKEYKEIQAHQKKMNKKLEAYMKLEEKKQKKINKAKLKNKSDEELTELVETSREELLEKKKEMDQLDAYFQQELLMALTKTSKLVAKEYGIDVVLNKQALFYGGFDMTNFVLEELNK